MVELPALERRNEALLGERPLLVAEAARAAGEDVGGEHQSDGGAADGADAELAEERDLLLAAEALNVVGAKGEGAGGVLAGVGRGARLIGGGHGYRVFSKVFSCLSELLNERMKEAMWYCA